MENIKSRDLMDGGAFSDYGESIVEGRASFTIIDFDVFCIKEGIGTNKKFATFETYTDCCNYIIRIVNEIM